MEKDVVNHPKQELEESIDGAVRKGYKKVA